MKIANCRSDFHHKLSRRIVNESKVICVESLAVAKQQAELASVARRDFELCSCVKNRILSKVISQVGWGQFCTMLKYKAEQFGKTYVEVDRFFASSKTCNVCLNQVNSLPLEIRFWNCDNCQTKNIDRDVNAALNIRDEGLRILTSGTGDKAYRQTVRRSNRGRKKSTTTLVSG